MDKIELEKIKEKALEAHIPIIMDDTLEVMEKILEKYSADLKNQVVAKDEKLQKLGHKEYLKQK